MTHPHPSDSPRDVTEKHPDRSKHYIIYIIIIFWVDDVKALYIQ